MNFFHFYYFALDKQKLVPSLLKKNSNSVFNNQNNSPVSNFNSEPEDRIIVQYLYGSYKIYLNLPGEKQQIFERTEKQLRDLLNNYHVHSFKKIKMNF